MKDCIRLSVPTGLALFAGAMLTATAMGWDRCPEDWADPIGVEQQDLTGILSRWGDPACAGGGCPEDVTAPDGVEQQDLAAVLARWGDPACLEPEFNDTCDTAFTVAVPGEYTGNNTGATSDATLTCGTSAMTFGVWYHVVGDGQDYIAHTCNMTSLPTEMSDTKLMVYSDCPALTCVVGNDDACGLYSTVQWTTVPGQDYYIKLGSYSAAGTAEGDYILTLEVVEPCVFDCVDTEGEGDCFAEYVDNYNGGSNSDPCVVSTATCGVPICGSTGEFDFTPPGEPTTTYRDTDWYSVTIAVPSFITMDAYAGDVMIMLEILGDPCNAPGVGAVVNIPACEATSWTSDCLDPGTYTYFLSTTFTGVPCGTQYEVTFTCVECPPCEFDCVDTEGEGDCFAEYVDNYNGGSNSSPCVLSTAECGVPVCGSTGEFDFTPPGEPTTTYRDTDWYQVTTPMVSPDYTITVDVYAEADMLMLEILGDPCFEPGVGDVLDIFECELATWTSSCQPAGTYTYFLSTGFTGVPCGSQYEVTFTCEPCVPALGACCLGDGQCFDGYTVLECVAIGGLYTGDGVECISDPCPLACVVCNDTEGEGYCFEDYNDMYNGGANSTPCNNPGTFGTIECGVPLCGSTGTFLNGGTQNRDTDWFLVTINDPQVMTMTVTGSSDLLFGDVLYDGDPCNATAFNSTSLPLACEPGTLVTECLAPGTYIWWIGVPVFDGIPCGSQYEALLTCEPCVFPNGACCQFDMSCIDGLFEVDCIALDGLYMGDFVLCEAGLCEFPTGACCLPDDSCEEPLMQWECEQLLFGDYAGDGVLCADIVCPIPAYCDAAHTATGGADEYLANVTVGTIDNDTVDDGIGYHDYTALSTDMVIGTAYNFSCVNGNAWSLSNFVGFVDWNQDFDFEDAGEEFIITDVDNINGTAVITPPVGALTGPTRMRVRCYYGSTPAGPCNLEAYGETEDYTINVLP